MFLVFQGRSAPGVLQGLYIVLNRNLHTYHIYQLFTIPFETKQSCKSKVTIWASPSASMVLLHIIAASSMCGMQRRGSLPALQELATKSIASRMCVTDRPSVPCSTPYWDFARDYDTDMHRSKNETLAAADGLGNFT